KEFTLARGGRGGRGPAPGAPAPGGPPPSAIAALGAGGGRGGGGQQDFGFYLPFNWRGFYDFGSSLIGDWGVHILGPANWALQLHPEYLISVECIKKDALPPFTFPDEIALKYDFAARPNMPPVTVYWYHHAGGDAYLPDGMTPEDARKIPGQGAILPLTATTGSAPAKAARRRVPTSASRDRIPNGWCLVPRPSTTKASCGGTTQRASSRTIAKPTIGWNRPSAGGGKSNCDL